MNPGARRLHVRGSYSRASIWVLAAPSCSCGVSAAPLGCGSDGGEALHSLSGWKSPEKTAQKRQRIR